MEDISALIPPLDQLLYSAKSMPVSEFLSEQTLRRLEKEEFIYAIYQVLSALLEDDQVPEGGHTGIQEAMVAELLKQTHDLIVAEFDIGEEESDIRAIAWQSIDRLLIHPASSQGLVPWFLEESKVDLSSSSPYLSERLTLDVWESLLLDTGGLFDEFLWDTDWRQDELMDLPPRKADEISNKMGLNLEVVQALPHSPNESELRMAEHYIRYVIWKDEVIRDRNMSAPERGA